MDKLIITVAPTGSLPRKAKTPHVPVTPREIAEDALRCEDAGASILHIHVRDREENPSDDPHIFQEVVDLLAWRPPRLPDIHRRPRRQYPEGRRTRLG